MTKPAHDVAISFLTTCDQHLALSLYEQLSSSLDVFVHQRKQEDIVGTDGMESLKAVFQEARQVVILYRKGWGGKGWTGVEEKAIQERALKLGWDFITMVQLKDGEPPPNWWSPTHLTIHYAQYAADLPGAIRNQAQRLGSQLRTATALDLAKAAKIRKDHAQLRQAMLERNGGQALQAEFERLAQALDAQVGAIRTVLPVEFEHAANELVLRYEQASVRLDLVPFGDLGLTRRDFRGQMLLPSERRKYLADPPKFQGERRYRLDFQPLQEWCWVSGGKSISTEALADELLQHLIKLKEAADQQLQSTRLAADSISSDPWSWT